MALDPAPQLPEWIESLLPEGHQRYCVPVDSQIHVHVTETGSGIPVLMQHGNPTWGFLYRKIMDLLPRDRFRCIAPDLIGLGFSTRPSEMSMHTLINHAGWIGALIDGLDLKEFIFVGQDWGGPIGIRAIADRPDRLKGAVLMNTAVAPPKPGFKPTPFHRFSNMSIVSDIVFRLFGFPQIILHKVQGDPASIRGEVARAYRYRLRRFKENQAPLALARMVPGSSAHPSVSELEVCRKYISTFAGPVELIWGMRDPILARALKRTVELLPDAPVTRTQAGHFLQEEVPDQIAAAIRRVAERARNS